MEEKLLKSIGISAKIAAGFIIAFAVGSIYRNYHELIKTKMEIKLLRKKLKDENIS